MNSFKNSPQGQRLRDWQRDKNWDKELERQRRYVVARQKALKWQRIHSFMIIGCAIAVCGILMFWP